MPRRKNNNYFTNPDLAPDSGLGRGNLAYKSKHRIKNPLDAIPTYEKNLERAKAHTAEADVLKSRKKYHEAGLSLEKAFKAMKEAYETAPNDLRISIQVKMELTALRAGEMFELSGDGASSRQDYGLAAFYYLKGNDTAAKENAEKKAAELQPVRPG